MKISTQIQASLVTAGFILAPQAFAAEQLTPVVVSATRSVQSLVSTPSSITIITRQQIEQSGARHIAEVLNTQASVQLIDLYGNGSRVQISMRGFADNAKANTLIMVDGRRLSNPDLSAADLSSISLKDVEQIEIIQGSAGTLFGDQAVGGVINIITRKPGSYRAYAEVEAGSYDTRNLRGSISNQVGKLGYRFSVEKTDTDNFREHNEQDDQNLLGRIDYQLNNTSLFLDVQSVDEELQLPGTLTEAQLDDDPTQVGSTPEDFNESRTDVARVGIITPLTANWNLEAEYTDRDSDIEGKSYASDFTQKREHKSFTPRLVGTVPGQHGDTLVTIGIDYNVHDYDFKLPGWFIDTVAEQKTRAFYVQSVIPVSDKMTLTVGGRRATVDYDVTDASAFPAGIELDDDVTVFEAGLSFQLNNDTRLFARVDENYRFAKIDENTYTSPGVVGLDTQTGKSIELGSEWKTRHSSAKLVVYSLRLDNEIEFDPTAPSPGFFPGANANLDPTTRNGLILEGTHQYSPVFNLNAQYNYIDSSFDGGPFDGNDIPFVASHNLTLNAHYKITGNWSTTAEARYTGSRYQGGDYTNSVDKLPSLTVLNAQLRYQQKNWSASLRINNLTDKDYAGYAVYNGFSSGYYP
ncbi:MAG: TonB-dependent receptor, partial [Thioalkalispiraceae bacterium]